MKKILFGIFAHPDDETFGPCGTLIQEAENGTEIHLILLTDGQAGVNPDSVTNLGATRLIEWQTAVELIGATSHTALHYQDGGLSHGLYEEIGAKIRDIISEKLSIITEPGELSFITFDQNGLTGHLDHIAASYLTTQIFHTISSTLPENISLKELAYFCLSEEEAPDREWKTYYTPIGRDMNFINRTVDVSAQLNKKYEAIKCHYSQRQDADNLRAKGDALLSKENFHVAKIY